MKDRTATDGKRGAARWWAIVLLTLTSGAILFSSGTTGTPVAAEETELAASRELSDAHLDKEPVRGVSGLEYQRNNWKYDCMECHRSLKANWHLPDQLMEHRGLELKHGSNRFCLNCHHPQNRNVYVDYDGSEIAESDIVLLCAKCHGPQHRDWIIGAHGRRNGYWDTSRGASGRLSCIQCHDPHDPSFKEMKPLSPPTYPARAAGGRNHSTKHHEEAQSHDE